MKIEQLNIKKIVFIILYFVNKMNHSYKQLSKHVKQTSFFWNFIESPYANMHYSIIHWS